MLLSIMQKQTIEAKCRSNGTMNHDDPEFPSVDYIGWIVKSEDPAHIHIIWTSEYTAAINHG